MVITVINNASKNRYPSITIKPTIPVVQIHRIINIHKNNGDTFLKLIWFEQ